MALITYSTITVYGMKTANAMNHIRQAMLDIQRIKQAADDITAGGTTPANLETNTLFSVASGQGANFYTALQSVIAALFATPSSWTPVQSLVDLDPGQGN
jgi:hypothetical protein